MIRTREYFLKFNHKTGEWIVDSKSKRVFTSGKVSTLQKLKVVYEIAAETLNGDATQEWNDEIIKLLKS